MADSVKATLNAAWIGGSTGQDSMGKLPAVTMSLTPAVGVEHRKFILAKNAADSDIDLGALTAGFKFLMLYSDVAITAKISATTNVTVLEVPAAGMIVLQFAAVKDHLYLSEANVSAANVQMIIAA